MSMFGQWRGWINGTNHGELLLNVDRDRPTRGRIHVVDDQAPFIADVLISESGASVTGQLSSAIPFPLKIEGKQYPSGGTITGKIDVLKLSGTWKADTGSSGTFQLMSAEAQPAVAPTMRLSWSKFVEWALSKVEDMRLIFRGQSATYPLTTTFHRAGRRDMVRYWNDDVPLLKRNVEAATSSLFAIDRDDERGTLLNIAQHHGFPTPLVDFTHSAFVAAYFAFCGVKTRRVDDPDMPVRIFALDGSVLPPAVPILNIKPTLGRLLLGARMNPRVLPQQSVNVFSDVPDIEGWIAEKALAENRSLLEVIDLPASDSVTALRHLRRFGLSTASLFPGLDGACRGLAEDLFP
jgi:hypothetical protein